MDIKPESDLRFSTKIAYGAGSVSSSIYTMITGSFFLFFLTNTAGINPTLAGTILLMGQVWDGINDPLIGWLSDRTTPRSNPSDRSNPSAPSPDSAPHSTPWLSSFIAHWGKRYPWIILGSVPLGIIFFLQWWVPPISHRAILFAYYVVITLLAYTLLTVVFLPYSAIAAELTQGYDERTTLSGVTSFFTIIGIIGALVLAQFIFSAIPDSNPHQQYIVLGLVGGGLISSLLYLFVWGTHQQYREVMQQRMARVITGETKSFWSSWRMQMQLLRKNRAFQNVTLLILCTGVASTLATNVTPYFVQMVMRLPQQHITQVLLISQGSALAALFFWNFVGKRVEKKGLLFLGLPIWMMAHLGLLWIGPEQIKAMYGCFLMAGIGFATALLAPTAMLPDIIDLDELQTGQRREGMFYGVIVQARKFTLALAIFSVGRSLDHSGFRAENITQPDSALWAMRSLISWVPMSTLAIALVFAYFYPITRAVHQDIVLKLQNRRQN